MVRRRSTPRPCPCPCFSSQDAFVIEQYVGHFGLTLTTTRLRQASKFKPLFDRVLVQRAVAMTKSAGGIMLPESALPKMNEATVVAVGPGKFSTTGTVMPMVNPRTVDARPCRPTTRRSTLRPRVSTSCDRSSLERESLCGLGVASLSSIDEMTLSCTPMLASSTASLCIPDR